MGYQELIDAQYKRQVDQFTKVSAETMLAKVPETPAVPDIPPLPPVPGVPGVPGVFTCTPSYASIAAALPPLPIPYSSPDIGKSDFWNCIPSILKFPELPPIPKIPDISKYKKMLPKIKILPECTNADDEDAILDKIKSIFPGLEGINDLSFPVLFSELRDFVATSMGGEQAASDCETLEALIPVIKARCDVLIKPPDPATIENVAAYAQLLLGQLPKLPPMPNIPGLATIKTICTPPVEAPESKVLMPDPETGKNEMDKNGVNLKAQAAILAESKRQELVNEWIPDLNIILDAIPALFMAIENIRENFRTLSEASSHPKTEEGWKTFIELFNTNIDTYFDLIFEHLNNIKGMSDDCMNTETKEPFESLKTHYTAFEELYEYQKAIAKGFGDSFYCPVILKFKTITDKVGYAIWETNGTELSPIELGRANYEKSIIMVSYESPKPYEQYSVEADVFAGCSLFLEAGIKKLIAQLQDSLPPKG